MARHAVRLAREGELTMLLNPFRTGVLLAPREYPVAVAGLAVLRGYDLGQIGLGMPESMLSRMAKSAIGLEINGLHRRLLLTAAKLAVAVFAEFHVDQEDRLLVAARFEIDLSMTVYAAKSG